jgi:hypothetical protein
VIAQDPPPAASSPPGCGPRGRERRERIWFRDADAAEAVHAILFAGLLPGWYPPGYDCGACGYATSAESDGLLAVVRNLSQYHREHEKYYSEAPLADGIALRRAAPTLIALAERWASWGMAGALLGYPQLADLLGERHKIIGNNWQNACTAQLVARYLRRAIAIMKRVDFSPSALRADPAGPRSAPGYLYAAAELINHAADLAAASSVLTHQNERRWRIFHERIEQITAPAGTC